MTAARVLLEFTEQTIELPRDLICELALLPSVILVSNRTVVLSTDSDGENQCSQRFYLTYVEQSMSLIRSQLTALHRFVND